MYFAKDLRSHCGDCCEIVLFWRGDGKIDPIKLKKKMNLEKKQIKENSVTVDVLSIAYMSGRKFCWPHTTEKKC